MEFSFSRRRFDLVIIGSGGAGLMTALSAINSGVKNIAVVSKVIPTNSHTVSAKGGINAALGNVVKDDWKWHAHDTLKGSDYLADIDAVNILCSNAKSALIKLEEMGVVFSRDEKGQIAQRAYGGQRTDFGQGDVAYRACYSKDKTGHTILHSLYQQALKLGVNFFSEFFVTDLLIEEEKICHGLLGVDLNSGELVVFESQIVVLATGGYSQIYQNTTSSLICSGDGSALVFQEGLPLQDMEFVQFHPTGIYGSGFLVTEAARGEGGYLLNGQGERFMKKYSPKAMELASRDIISQAMATEIFEGRGAGKDKNFLYLDLRHLSEDVFKNKLPGVVELVKNFAQLDVKKDLIPVAPSAHYTMGGVPCSVDCFVIDGLMAVGEVACLSVHGANRLGCNSLLDLIVFGEIAGKKAAENILRNKSNQFQKFNCEVEKIITVKIKKLSEIFAPKRNIEENYDLNLSKLREFLQENNEKNLGVFREKALLKSSLERITELFEIFNYYHLRNKNLIWNEELVEYFELRNLFLNSLATNFAALNRFESRGAHYRRDFPNHDDKNFLAHSLVKINDAQKQQANFAMSFFLKPVNS